MERYIYILSCDGKPLMPTKREGHIQKLLKRGKARIVSHLPFVVQLKYETENKTQPLYGGTDPGRTNIGNAVVTKDGKVLYKDHLTTANKDVPKHMAERKKHRQASRRGERLARKRLAKKNHTTTAFPEGRILPGCNEPVMLKDIINTESRFNNRKREEGWLCPTARHLVETHLHMVDKICRILPVTEWTLETNKFAFMKMDDDTVYGMDYQNGRMKRFPDAASYVHNLQNEKCAICGRPIEHIHHIIPRSAGGSDLPENLVGLCRKCHKDVHTGNVSVEEIGLKKKYGALSVLNQAIPHIYKGLEKRFGEKGIHVCSGYDTKRARELFRLGKDHPDDAEAIAAMYITDHIETDAPTTYEVHQFRRHNRAVINNQRERTYRLNGKVIAKNRKPRFEQKGKALSTAGLTRQEISKLTVQKSQRRYNSKDRIMPGALFMYEGKTYVLTGQISKGQYYRAYGQKNKNFPASKCRIIQHNNGLVYIS